MGVQVTLQDIQSGFLSAAAHTANNTLIEAALDKALDRTASTNNAMAVDFDMGSNNIINLANGVSNKDAVTVEQLNGTVSALASGIVAIQRETQTGVDLIGNDSKLSGISYTVGGNNLWVWRNGVFQTPGEDYTEKSSIEVTWLDVPNPTDKLTFITNLSVGNAESVSTTNMQVEEQLGSQAVANKFTLADVTYTPGINNLLVFRNGQYLSRESNYVETSSSEVTLNFTPNPGDTFTFLTNVVTTLSAPTVTSSITHVEDSTTYALNTYLQNRHVINVKDKGADPTGTTDSTAAIQAAIDAAEARAGNFLAKSGVVVLFPEGIYLVSSLTLDANAVTLMGEGRGPILKSTTNSGHALLKVGNDTYSTQIYHVSIENLTFVADSSIADRTDTTAIELHDTISSHIKRCTFNNWNKSIDGYRFNGSFINNCEFRQHQRTSASKADSAIALNGRSTDGSTSGGNHISECEIWGSSSTQDPVYTSALRVDSVDGLYVDSCHMYKADYNVLFSPDGTKTANYVEGVTFSNCYFDEPGVNNVRFEGSTADNSGSGGKNGLFQNIIFDGCYFRGGATTDSGATFANYLVVSDVTSTSQDYKNIRFSDCKFRQAGIAAMLFSGGGSSRVEVINLAINDNTFEDNRRDGTANYSVISAEVDSVTFSGNTIGADANSGSKLLQFVVSGSQGALIQGNNLLNATFTDVDPLAVTDLAEVRLHISDNLMPSVGTKIDQIYYLETTDATPTNIFTYTVPSLSSGVIRAKILGRKTDGTRVISREFVGAFREIGAGPVWVGADPVTERDVSINPSTTATSLTFSSGDLILQITGLAAEALEWTADIYMVAE